MQVPVGSTAALHPSWFACATLLARIGALRSTCSTVAARARQCSSCFPVVLRTDGIGVLRLPRVSVAGAQEMQDYHAYVIGPDGRIELRIYLFCSGDEAAREINERTRDRPGADR